MKIVHIAYSDQQSGANNGVYRLHRALRAAGQDSTMLVNKAVRGDWTVTGPSGMWATMQAWLRPRLASVIKKGLRVRAGGSRSPAIIPSCWHRRLNRSDADILHLHWINAEMMSVADIGRIKKPLVWTIRDMWAFSGAEHYPEGFRWREGYRRDNRPKGETGFDLNRWTWNRKRKHWKQPFNIIVASRWMARCAQESALMHDWPITIIPNTLDTEVWKPIDKLQARKMLGFPADEKILLFGAVGGGKDGRKGFALLLEALAHLNRYTDNLRLVIFGELRPKEPPKLFFPVTYMGRLYDDLSLRVLYSAADVYVNPSKQEAFGNTAMEAHACGTPAVVFDNSGLVDIVQHKETGYVAKAFDAEDLAHGIQWVLEDMVSSDRLSRNSRNYAVEHFSYPIVSQKYEEVYRKVISERNC